LPLGSCPQDFGETGTASEAGTSAAPTPVLSVPAAPGWSLAGSAAFYESLATQPTPGARRIIRAVREQSQIEAMREALRGDRERAKVRREAGRSGVPRVPTFTRHDPPAAQVEAPAAPPAPTDRRE